MIFGKNITKSFGAQVLFDSTDFQINPGEKIGVIGRNGAGKSTLFHLLTGGDTIDDGTISIPENYKIGTLDQHLNFEKENIVDEVCQSLPHNKEHDQWRGEKILSGLGFSAKDFLRHSSEFSGGFQIRIKLAQLLLSEPDLLLLDEPTNYLDILAARWLEGFLRTWQNEIVLISHDRTFLEKTTTHTIFVHRQKLRKLRGGPEKIIKQIEYEEDIWEKTRVNDEKERNRQAKFIREFRSGARSAGLVQSRIKMLNKRKNLESLTPMQKIEFSFPYSNFNGAQYLEARNLQFSYDGEKDLLKKCSFRVMPGEKIAVIGQNGAGKSTLLKVLTEELTQQSGVLKKNVNLETNYFGQSNVLTLAKDNTVLEEIAGAGEISEQKARTIAGNLLFSGGLALKRIEVLSGGEKSRVNLGRMMARETNFLLLDEPTNHLDYESVKALENAVKNFPGAVVFVSHNEDFLKNCADKLIVFDGGEVFEFMGTYEEFLNKKGFLSEQQDQISTLDKIDKKQKNPVHKEDAKEKKRLLRPLEREINKLERKISRLENEKITNKENFDKAQRQGNILKMETLGIEYQELQNKINKLTEDWDKVAEEITKISA